MADSPSIPNPDCPECGRLRVRIGELEERIRRLEGRLATNSSNSSVPPSANPLAAPKPVVKEPTGRKPGGQPGHAGHSRERLPPDRVTEIIPHLPEVCERCSAALPKERGPNDPEPTWHQVAELPVHPVIITEHQGHARTCARCGHVTRKAIPQDITAHGFGSGLTAAVAFMGTACQGSTRTVQEIVETVLGVPMAVGTVCNLEQEVSSAVKTTHEEIGAAVRAAPVANVDETGWKEGGDRFWLWVAATTAWAYFTICAGRGKDALRAMLGEAVGIVCSDRWGAYNIFELVRRQLCWAHLKRDFRKKVDEGGVGMAVGHAGLAACKRLFALWHDFKQGVIDRAALQAGMQVVSLSLHEALTAGAGSGDKRVMRFCRNLLNVWPALWTFARIEGVEPTNNHAERTLRLGVLLRKIGFGTWSAAGSRFTERMLSIVQTLRLRGRRAMEWLRQAVGNHRLNLPPPPLPAAA